MNAETLLARDTAASAMATPSATPQPLVSPVTFPYVASPPRTFAL